MKPPIGIIPEFIWWDFLEVLPPSKDEIKGRIKELRAAKERYLNAGLKPLLKWDLELKKYK